MADSMGSRLRRGWIERQRRQLEEQDRQISREEIRLNLREVEVVERRREVTRLAERLGEPDPIAGLPDPSFDGAAQEAGVPGEVDLAPGERSPEEEVELLRRQIEARRAALPLRERALRAELARLDRVESDLNRRWQRLQRSEADPDSPLSRPRRPVRLGGGRSMTQTLLVVIAAIFVLDMLTGGWLLRAGAKYGPAIWGGQWYRLITSAFLHAGLMHLATNAFSIYIIGPVVENMLGARRFLLVYLISALMGSAASLYFSPLTLSVGASGAIFGLMGYILYARWQRPRVVPAELRQWVLGILLLNVFITFVLPRIDVWGHLGGLVGGFAAGFVAGAPGPSPLDLARSGRPGALGAAVVASVALVGFVWLTLQPGANPMVRSLF
ncbi:rhomboid family intramembrane serine protease [Limnochorda pilosa]|uniref:Peptidase S54 rhomboid domain-containing protein n=1 Tax=Limnochorda pilosa TaxID=1555112 RepID=A0A0K2SK00_LIMPI|nr:rhomboid family intramembrane serine protease [Limnochorda pilosa]BAS27342.1 hypothetical protein LIP_1494 [Limnochorda pilosa]